MADATVFPDDLTREEEEEVRAQHLQRLAQFLPHMTLAKCRKCNTNEMTGFGRLTKKGKEVPMCDACLKVTREPPPHRCGNCLKRHGNDASLAFCASCYAAKRKPPRRCDNCREIAECFMSKDHVEEYMARHGPNAPKALCMSCYTTRRELKCVE